MEQPSRNREHWERAAHQWAAFTRGPEPDAYRDYAPRFFAFLPPPSGRTLEVGCGEGRVTRDLRARGYDTVSIDAAPTMVELARASDPTGTYLVSDAATLPFPDRSFALVVAYNVLMDVDDLLGTVREAARVLAPGGRFAACLTHPLSDAGRFAERSAEAPFVISGSYLGSRRFEAVFRRNGVNMPFAGWAHPLEAYFEAFEAAGLVLEALREPASTPEMIDRDPAEARWGRIPNFLFLRLRHGEPPVL
jgi:SAM-dependent methyltransferase